ncbi:bifunctional 2-polyprenyl-6-hydroxyphenol methylase/3-demethylubiquinol 3-O-methyltransferase UbiG [Pigmentiphaga sp.]|uniref:class I SAM-dependent methyltransferase n=1 Tax=Pigmentiphaga sp. TaxID=1977564 RepID=UPI002600F185|nr:class I SAM-dependent methyltransferase [Pigmentiphaga sp.]MBX6319507.1 class I SAM-dependent methyltransferase [Pigmentiphaga sp.]
MKTWDERYSRPGYKYGTEPNRFLAEQEPRLPAGSRVLLPGDGEGRNSVWLAQRGHQVLAVDSSQVGLDKALALASLRGITITTLHADLADWSPPAATCSGVALIFVHLPSAVRPGIHRRLARALAPGGWLILECFHPRQLDYPSGGPREVDMLSDLAAIRSDFSPLLEEVVAWEGEVVLNEGEGHKGPAFVTRYVGRMPAP